MERVLITGGAGFIGTNVAQYLINNGYDVYATYHSKEPRYRIKGVKYLQGDLLDSSFCTEAMKDKDIVVMCAGYVGGIAMMKDNPLDLINDSSRININTLEAAYLNKVKKCVFISSGAVYPSLNHYAKEEEAFDGEPIDKYYSLGWAKRFGELLCKMYSEKIENPFDTTVLRIDNVYGPYDSFEGGKAHVVPSTIRKIIGGDNPVVIWGDGEEKKDFLYIEDLCNAITLAIEKADGFQSYNIVRGKNISINELAVLIAEIAGKKNIEFKHDLNKPSSISERNLAPQKAKSSLDFVAKNTLKEGLRKTIEWYTKERSSQE